MRITKIEDLHCDAGWRVNSVPQDHHRRGHRRLVGIHGGLWRAGPDRRHPQARRAADRPGPAAGRAPPPISTPRPGRPPAGSTQMAIAAIENALVDIKAKALGVPVYEMLGGPVRDRLQLYWSHCGTYRARHADRIREWAGVEPVRTLDDIVRLGAEVKRKGFKGLKTNLIRFDGGKPYMYGPGTGNPPGFPELNIDSRIVDAAVAQWRRSAKAPGRMSGCISTPTSTTRSTATSSWRGAGAARSGVAGDRPLRPGRPGADPPLGAHADRIHGRWEFPTGQGPYHADGIETDHRANPPGPPAGRPEDNL